MILLDTSGLFAIADRRDRAHGEVTKAFAAEEPPYLVSPFVLAELDYLMVSRLGVHPELEMLRDMGSGAYDLVPFDADDVRMAAEIVEQYADQQIGLADASIVVLANRYRTDRVLTLDTRHFRVLRTVGGRAFTILPPDA